MTSKEVKAALKSAKECIQSKNYASVVEHCEKVLAADEKNYHALVFLGVAHENLGDGQKCVECYTKATEIMPDQILALQGLLSYYEKNLNTANKLKLIPVYMKIIRLTEEGDPDKHFNLRLKFADLSASFTGMPEYESYFETCIGEYRSMLCSLPKLTEVSEKHTLLHSRILRVTILGGLGPYPTIKEESLSYFLLNHQTHDEISDDQLCKEYLEVVYDRYPENSSKACQELLQKSVKTVVASEVMVAISLDKAIVSDEPMPENTTDLVNNIRKLNPDSSVLQAWDVYHLCKDRKFSEAKNSTSNLLETQVAAFGLLAVKVDSGMHDTVSVDRNVDIIIKKLNDYSKYSMKVHSDKNAIIKSLLLLQADALLQEKEEDKVGKAGKICKQLKSEYDSSEADVVLCYLCLKVHNETLAGKIKDRLTGETAAELACIGWYHWYSKDNEQARKYLEEAVAKEPNEPNYLCQVARVYWTLIDTGTVDHKQCSITLMKAAKLDPFCSNIFFWLGRYFEKYGRDEEKALRCYRKAYDLKVTNESAAEYLVDALERQGRDEEAVDVLTEITENVSTAKWAWLQLGLYRVKEDAASAIQCFQIAIRADPKDAYCWQCLAEGYMNRGSYNAAMKTFTKANELDPECMYNLFQLANIKQLLGMHLEAVVDYQKILETSKDYVPALKGLAETHIQMAKEAMDKFYSMKAVDNCSLAIGYLTRASTRRPDLSMIWKLMGDACSILVDVPESLVKVNVPRRLCGEWKYQDLGLLELLQVGARAYTKAIQISNDDSVLWYDLGANFFHQARISGEDTRLEKAISCLRKSLSIDPKDSSSWSTLGVVLAKRQDKAEAQHCFIQAVQLDSHNAKAWANLGVLYLMNDNIARAHEAFTNAQSMAPEYVNGWIGQAMVAESVAHGETADLFRHSSELALHEEAALGYGHWITELLLQGVEIPEAVILNATTCLERYLDRDNKNPIALNMYGILQERQGLIKSASETLQKAVENCTDDGILPILKTNHARLLGKTGQFESAVVEFENRANVSVPLGLTYFKAKNYENAKSEYQNAIENSDGTTEPQIHAMLGLSSYLMGDLVDAKTHLFACAQAEEPHVYGLLALCAIGLLNQDLTLAGAVVQELDKFITENTVAEISRISVMYYIASDDFDSAFSFVQTQIEKFPQNVELYLQMIGISEKKESDLVDKVLETRSFGPDNIHKICRICMESNKPDLAFRYAHNDILLHPNDNSKWTALAYATILKILSCENFDSCMKLVDALQLIVFRCNETEVSRVKIFSTQLIEFTRKLNEVEFSDEMKEKIDFVVEMFKKYHHVTFEEPEKSDEKITEKSEEKNDESVESDENSQVSDVKVDEKAVLVQGFIEILAICLKDPSFSETSDLETVVQFYKSSGVYQFDNDIFSRDERVYSRKCVVKKNSNVKFPRPGLSCRLRCLAYDIATL